MNVRYTLRQLRETGRTPAFPRPGDLTPSPPLGKGTKRPQKDQAADGRLYNAEDDDCTV
jgi:hypothetical protein